MNPGGFPERTWRRRGLRVLFLLAALPLLTTFVWRLLPHLPGPGEAALLYTPVTLEGDDLGRRDVGRLHFLGGWTMSSPDYRLGGLSALRVEGGQAMAVSDVGMIMTFPLPGVSAAPRIRFRPVAPVPGADPDDRRMRDTEGLWLEGGRFWLTFERQNAIRRYDRATLNAEAGAQPAPMRRWWPDR